MPQTPIIIDCDPGVDDAIALLLAFASPELQILGITTVAGNVPLALTQLNARKMCELAKQTDIPVFAGCPRPILQALQTAEEIHGKTGLDGTTLPDPTMPLQPDHAVSFLIQTLDQATEPITLATLGPLTNVAIALIQAPHIARNIQSIVMMGGAITLGNITPAAEFNLYADPHAADVVFRSGIPITLLSLDVTHQVLTTPERLENIRAIASPVGQAAADLLSFYGQLDCDRYGMPGAPLHDPNVIAYLLQPKLYRGKPCHVAVETASPHSIGQTIIDVWDATGKSPNATVIQTADAEGFYQLLTNRLRTL
ncbi:MAG: nucleoside hydrolase [Leptolyngbyaceae bacterium]|nr:nucleoside hydrolase [Leptolyngbyaceae bacterium]